MNLKEYRQSVNITILEASKITNVPVRTYIRYENDEFYGNPLKRKMMLNSLIERYEITEEKGILSLAQIKSVVDSVLVKYESNVQFCYLFGSYAKGYQTEKSDVDLCISTDITGFAYFGLVEELREALNKKVDLIRLVDIKNNFDLLSEIMKDGIKIYEQHQR